VKIGRALAALAACAVFSSAAAASPGVKELVARFGAASGDDRIRYAIALGRTRKKAAVDALLLAFDVRHASPREMAAVADALGLAGDARASKELAGADDYLRSSALEYGELPSSLETLRLSILRAAGSCGGEAAVRMLESVIADKDGRAAAEAARGLGRLRVKEAVPALEQVASAGPDVTQGVFEALADIGDKRAATMIRAALDSPDKFVDIEAAYALHRLGDDGMIPRLEEALKSDPGEEKAGLIAAYYLVKLDKDSGLKHLDALMRKDDPVYPILAADALGKSGNPRALAPLLALSNFEDPALRAAAARNLGLLGGSRAEAALKRLRVDQVDAVRFAALSALAQLGVLD